MKSLKWFLTHAARICLGWVGSLVLWTLWLALGILAAFQVYIITADELAVPDFVLRQAEAQLQASGVRATFSRTTFDTSGRVLVENVRLSLPAYPEPIVTARAVHIRLSPWLLAMGRVEPREIEIFGLNAAAPAMLSPTGEPVPVVSATDIGLELAGRLITVQRLSGQIAGATVSARGSLPLRRERSTGTPGESLPDVIQRRFATLCRQALVAQEWVEKFDEPRLEFELAPSESGAPTVRVEALARALRLDQPAAIEVRNLRASTRLLLFGDAPPSDVALSADEIRLPGDVVLTQARTRVVGRYRLDGGQFDLREVQATVASARSPDVDLRAVSVRLFPRPLPKVEAQVVALVLEAPLTAQIEADFDRRQGTARFAGDISPRVLDLVSRRVGADVRRFFDFESMSALPGEVAFGPGWKFEHLHARVRLPRLNAYGVVMEDGRAVVELTPTRFSSPEAFARVGDNFAAGTYDHDLTNHHYRFVLDGQLRPLAIARWFKEWWPNFFQQLEFPTAPPTASVDVRGAWRDGSQSRVFVFADALRPVIRGTPLDRVRTLLFIRPGFYDAIEIATQVGEGEASGVFTYTSNLENFAWRSLDLKLESTLDLATTARLLGPLGTTLTPFQLERTPQLKIEAEYAAPDAPGGAAEKLRIEARTTGDFRYYHFPLQDVAFVAAIDHSEVSLENVTGRFGGGTLNGHVRLWGVGAERRLGFDVALVDSSLGLVASGLEEFFAAQKNVPPAPPGKFVQEKANVRLDLAASAEGRYDNTLSYRGAGSAVLRGAEIGEVPMLGLLSELFTFTALRFTEARTNFKIDGAKLVFPEFTVRGANSKIDAHGTYSLDRRELDFNAKIFPFQESESLLKSVVGAVLTPLSNALEVKLKGSLEKPVWSFVRGPSNLLRSFVPAPASENAPPPQTAPQTSPPTPAVPSDSPPR